MLCTHDVTVLDNMLSALCTMSTRSLRMYILHLCKYKFIVRIFVRILSMRVFCVCYYCVHCAQINMYSINVGGSCTCANLVEGDDPSDESGTEFLTPLVYLRA